MPDFDQWEAVGGPGPVQEPPYQGEDDDWGDSSSFDDWSTPSAPDDFQEGGDQGFGGDQSGASPGRGDGFIQQDDDDGWGSTSGMEEPIVQSQVPSDFADSTAQVAEYQPRQFKLSMKKVAFIVLAVGIVAALLLAGLDKIHIKPKPSQEQNPPVSTQEPAKQPQQDTTQPTQGGNVNANVDSVTLVEIPESTKLDYNGDVLTANGKVINKLKYVQGHQVLYCVNIGVAFGSSSETVSYYCTMKSYNNVSVGDVVVLEYQQVNDSYISVLTISK